MVDIRILDLAVAAAGNFALGGYTPSYAVDVLRASRQTNRPCFLLDRTASIICYDGSGTIRKTPHYSTPVIILVWKTKGAIRYVWQMPITIKELLTPGVRLAQHPCPTTGISVQVPASWSAGQPSAVYKLPCTANAVPAKPGVSNMIINRENNIEEWIDKCMIVRKGKCYVYSHSLVALYITAAVLSTTTIRNGGARMMCFPG